MENFRKPEHPVEPWIVSRWSQRALSGADIPDAVLFSAFEAARWAPSAGNTQPWRFIYAKRSSAGWPQFLGFLNERNRSWAVNAGALIVVLSHKLRQGSDGSFKPLRSHSFDTGAAWINFAHQARSMGWSTRAMEGFDTGAVRRSLQIPEDYEIEAMVAIGQPAADKSVLPEALRAMEQPNTRRPITEFISAERFSFS